MAANLEYWVSRRCRAILLSYWAFALVYTLPLLYVAYQSEMHLIFWVGGGVPYLLLKVTHARQTRFKCLREEIQAVDPDIVHIIDSQTKGVSVKRVLSPQERVDAGVFLQGFLQVGGQSKHLPVKLFYLNYRNYLWISMLTMTLWFIGSLALMARLV